MYDMKILQLISGNLGQGGAESLVIDLANAQTRIGHDVTICSFQETNKQMADQIMPDVHLHNMSKQPGVDFTLMFRIYKYIKTEHFDVVNCHLRAVFPYIILSLILLKRTKFFYTIHSDVLPEEPRKVMREIRRFFIITNRLTFIGISKKIGDDFKKVYRLQKYVPVIYNGRKEQCKTELFSEVYTKVASYKQDENTKVFVAVGRIVPDKNYGMLIKSFDSLKHKNIVLLIIGRDQNNFMKEHKYDIPNNTHYVGSVSNVYDYLLCSDCFIMSSTCEGLPISMIEAMSASLPIVSTPVGGIPDIVKDGENGYLSTSIELDNFVKTIKRYINDDKTHIEAIKNNNRNKFLGSFLIKKTAEAYISLYNTNL